LIKAWGEDNVQVAVIQQLKQQSSLVVTTQFTISSGIIAIKYMQTSMDAYLSIHSKANY
jgi:hypothetical protein